MKKLASIFLIAMGLLMQALPTPRITRLSGAHDCSLCAGGASMLSPAS